MICQNAAAAPSDVVVDVYVYPGKCQHDHYSLKYRIDRTYRRTYPYDAQYEANIFPSDLRVLTSNSQRNTLFFTQHNERLSPPRFR